MAYDATTDFDIFQEMVKSIILPDQVDSTIVLRNEIHRSDDVSNQTALASDPTSLPNIDILLKQMMNTDGLESPQQNNCDAIPTYDTQFRSFVSLDNGTLVSELAENCSSINPSPNQNTMHKSNEMPKHCASVDQFLQYYTSKCDLSEIQSVKTGNMSSVHNIHNLNDKLFLDQTLRCIDQGNDRPEMLEKMIEVLKRDMIKSIALISLLQNILKRSTTHNKRNHVDDQKETTNQLHYMSYSNPASVSSNIGREESFYPEVTSFGYSKPNFQLISGKEDQIVFEEERGDSSMQNDGITPWLNQEAINITMDDQDQKEAKLSNNKSMLLNKPADEPLQTDRAVNDVFVCPEPTCRQSFKSKQVLNLHKLKKHNIGKLFKCKECEFKTPRRKDFHGHLVSQHQKLMPGLRVYECKFCDYKCVDKLRLDEHEATHTGVKKYSCNDCGKFYTTKRGLRTHIKFHSTERPFKCALCKADFKVKSKLTDHLKLVHLKPGEKPFQCGYCQHKASIRGNVNQHIRNIHKDQPINVLVIGERISRKNKNYNYSEIDGSGEKMMKLQ